MNHLVCTTRNDMTVYVDLVHSAAAKQIARQPYILGLTREALQQTMLKGTAATVVHNMGRTIGYDFVVATDDTSKVFYAKIIRDDVYTRFVRDPKPASTQFLTLTLKRVATSDYELLSVAVGKAGPPRPGSPDETAESKAFWAHHAYVLDKESLQAPTITKDCPY
jgi:hypothetical protein